MGKPKIVAKSLGQGKIGVPGGNEKLEIWMATESPEGQIGINISLDGHHTKSSDVVGERQAFSGRSFLQFDLEDGFAMNGMAYFRGWASLSRYRSHTALETGAISHTGVDGKGLSLLDCQT